MDPILAQVLHQLVTAQRNAAAAGDSISPEGMDAFVRQQTQGKYGLSDILGKGGWRGLATSLTEGLTGNWADEIIGGLNKLGGGKGDVQQQIRDTEELYHGQHPVLDDVTQFAGGVLPAFLTGGASEASSGLAAIGKGAAVGAGLGALQGAGAGNTAAEKVAGGLAGGVLGGVAGAAIPGGAEMVNHFRSSATRGARRIGNAIAADGGVDELLSRLKGYEDTGRGDVVTLGDLGDHLRSQMDFAANSNDETAIRLAKLLRARQEDATDRLLQGAKAGVGDPHAPSIQAQLAADRAQWAQGPDGYGGIRDANPSFDTGGVSKYFNTPQVASAWKQARLAGDITQGSPLDELLARLQQANPTTDPAVLRQAAESGAMGQDVAAMAKQSRPVSFDDLQQFKRALDDKVTSAYRSGNGALAESYKTVRDAATQAMEDAVPNVRGVNAEYSRLLKVENAVQDGVEAFHQNDTRGLAAQVAALSNDPQQLDAFRKGMASELLASLRSQKVNANVADRLMNASPAMQDKLETLFGNETTFQRFMHEAEQESELARLKGALANSATARRLQQQGIDPAEIGISLATGGLHGGLLDVGLNVATGAVRHNLMSQTGREVGELGMTQGGDAIRALLKSWAARDAATRLGTRTTVLAPAAAGTGLGLLYKELQGADDNQ